MSRPLLDARSLHIAYAGDLPVIRDIDLAISAGECVALVGPSGSGKSTIARAILGLLPSDARRHGQLHFAGQDLLSLDEAGFRKLRGLKIGYVAQDPYQACDPLRKVHDHVADAWRVHALRPAQGLVEQRLDQAGIEDAPRAMHQYPHQWSGGMLQRASIVAATAHHPRLLIADEPTSALDADRADAIMAMLKANGGAILLISHDLELVMRHADRIALCHQGGIVETGMPAQLLASENPQTRRLVSAFALPPRQKPQAAEPEVLRLAAIGKTFTRGTHVRTILDNLDLTLARGEIVGITGPSGCGKSTLLRIVAGLEKASSGHLLAGAGLDHPGAIMPVFQDPVGSLDARWPVWRSLTEPLTARHRPRLGRPERLERARHVLGQVGLDNIDLMARPAELSSGQCQRISVARALIAAPALVLADEPTSALDTLARRQVLDMLLAAASAGTAILLVSHDRKMLAGLCDRSYELAGGRLLPVPGN